MKKKIPEKIDIARFVGTKDQAITKIAETVDALLDFLQSTEEGKENWQSDFISKFFVYKLGGKFPDHVGAQIEAVKWIEELLKTEREKWVKGVCEKLEKAKYLVAYKDKNLGLAYREALSDAIKLLEEVEK